jgi:Yersinia/Haemophilus virulence surface antigen
MGTPTSEVIAKLAGYGSKTGEFVQATKGNTLAQGQVDEGFCKGVCLDWTRRVLQVQPERRTDQYLSFSSHPEHAKAQTNLQAGIQMNLDSRKIVATTKKERRRTVHDTLFKLYNENLSQQNVAVQPSTITALQEFVTFGSTPGHEVPMSRVKGWIETLQAQMSSANTNTEVSWRSFAQSMDELHSEGRATDQRHAPKKTFSNISIVASTDRDPYNSAFSAITTLLALGEFTEGRVVIAGFGLRKSGQDTGHAVALYRQNTGKFYFLDPNYGVFDYTRQGAEFALRYLFAGLPTNINTKHPDGSVTTEKKVFGPIYGEDGCQITNGMSYMIFARA